MFVMLLKKLGDHFNEVLEYIDQLLRINRLMNARDIFNDFNLKATSAAKNIAKIDWLSKLDTGGRVTLKDLFMAKSLMDNIGEHGFKRYLQECFLVWGR